MFVLRSLSHNSIVLYKTSSRFSSNYARFVRRGCATFCRQHFKKRQGVLIGYREKYHLARHGNQAFELGELLKALLQRWAQLFIHEVQLRQLLVVLQRVEEGHSLWVPVKARTSGGTGVVGDG